MPFVVKEIQPTPNPNAVKFILDRPIVAERLSFFSAEAACGHPIAERFFGISGISSLLLLGDFVTVNKLPSARWANINAKVKRVLAEL